MNTMSANAPVHVALAVYDPKGTYSQHAGVVMTSIFENTKSPVVVHILHDETLTKDNRGKFIRTAEKYGQNVNFVDARAYRAKLSKDVVALVDKIYSIGTLYRLFIPGLLDLDKVIYLDCDIVVKLDIQELWDTDLEGKCLGGVSDRIHGVSRFSHDAISAWLNGCRLESYINAGVLLMDLKSVRERGELFERTMTWLFRHKHSANYADQDALNALFLNSIKILDPKFNYFSFRREPGDEDFSGRIVHFIGIKPWRELTGLATERLYWSMYLRSAWGEGTTVDELISILGRVASLSPQLHRHTKQCYRQIGLRLARDILHLNFFRTVGLLLRELFARLRLRLSIRQH